MESKSQIYGFDLTNGGDLGWCWAPAGLFAEHLLARSVEGRRTGWPAVGLRGAVTVDPTWLPAWLELAVHRWSSQSSDVPLSVGDIERRKVLQHAMVGALLDARIIGVHTLIEVTALLEASAIIDPGSWVLAEPADDPLS